MTKTDIATRVHNHTWKLDPIVRSLIDTDFYKLLMLQMIWKLYPEVDATFSLINRTKTVRLAEEIDEMELRNRPDPVMVYKVVADSPLVTIRARAQRPASAGTMHLAYGDRGVLCGPMRPRVTIGRDADNDICIDDEVVSRHHAEIALRGDRFMLVDRSTNGTYVYADSGPMLRLVRDELALTGAGRIALGVDETPHAIFYRLTLV